MIAGFETPTAGDIPSTASGVAMPPYRRNLGMVFQNYALFPHMTVADNIAFPLKLRGCRRPSAPGWSARRWSWSICRARRALAAPALGRPAAARGAWPARGLQAAAAADGRAAGRARQAAAREPADRDAAPACRSRHDLHLCDARPGRGAHHVRPHRRHERRQGGAGRAARGALRPADQPLRRGLHRRVELPARDRARHRGRRRRGRVRGRDHPRLCRPAGRRPARR